MTHDATSTHSSSGVQELRIGAVSHGARPVRTADTKAPSTPERIAEFWSRAHREGECLIWHRARNGRGYGRFNVNGKNESAHRVAYLLANGPLPSGLVVRHACDRPACIEPRHLLLGTQLDNVRDKYERGRANQAIGSRCSSAKITERDVLTIRRMRAVGVPAKNIGRRFGLSATATIAICDGRQWRHVGGPLTESRPDPAAVEALRLTVERRAHDKRTGATPRYKLAIRLIEERGLSIGAAAREVGISDQAVRSAIARSR